MAQHNVIDEFNDATFAFYEHKVTIQIRCVSEDIVKLEGKLFSIFDETATFTSN